LQALSCKGVRQVEWHAKQDGWDNDQRSSAKISTKYCVEVIYPAARCLISSSLSNMLGHWCVPETAVQLNWPRCRPGRGQFMAARHDFRNASGKVEGFVRHKRRVDVGLLMGNSPMVRQEHKNLSIRFEELIRQGPMIAQRYAILMNPEKHLVSKAGVINESGSVNVSRSSYLTANLRFKRPITARRESLTMESRHG
jgi:hypothetical protein